MKYYIRYQYVKIRLSLICELQIQNSLFLTNKELDKRKENADLTLAPLPKNTYIANEQKITHSNLISRGGNVRLTRRNKRKIKF